MQHSSQNNRLSPIFRPSLIAVAVASATLSLSIQANPTGPTVIHGNVSIDQSQPGISQITNSPNAIINWQSFSIEQNEITRFIQQSNQSAVLNRVMGGEPSQILGQLISNGQVLLINPNGIVFGAGSQIDTAGFIASTLNLNNDDFLSGNYHFIAGDDSGDLSNQGIIRAVGDGHVVLIAPNIENSGIISTEGGHITLAAGEQLTITSLDDPRIAYQVQAPDNEILNVGQLITAGGVAQLFAGTITHSGEINADSVQVDDQGQVWLVAQGDINLTAESVISSNNQSGKAGEIHIQAYSTEEGEVAVISQQGLIEAHGEQGGRVSISADSMFNNGRIDLTGEAVGGQVTVHLEQRLLETESSEWVVDAVSGVAGAINVKADVSIFSSASYSAEGGSKGGKIVVTAPEVKLVAADIDTSGANYGGDIRVGGGFYGEEITITNADHVYINNSSVLRADAHQNGDGGSVVVWADETTRFSGFISATGGLEGGDGGTAEVSGEGSLGYNGVVNLSAPEGTSGDLLLDPKNITITSGTAATIVKTELIDPNPGAEDVHGNNRTILSNGYIALRQEWDDFGGTDAGAMYVFNPDTGALAYSLVGANSGDRIGNNGIYNLSGGYLLRSTLYGSSAGAVTFFTAVDGVNGTISDQNSLLGSQPGDNVGDYAPLTLALGKYLLQTPTWGDNQGAWTWFDSTTGTLANGASIAGVIGSSNSLVGGTGGDVTESFATAVGLTSGIYALRNQYWDDEILSYPSTEVIYDAGAVTLFNATTGKFLDGSDFVGTISSENSLVGSQSNDRVGYYNPDNVGDGYLLRTPHWGNNQGAWTWFDPVENILANGQEITGEISSANSLVGGNGGDSNVDFGAAVHNFGSDRYGLSNSGWDGVETIDAGAFILFDGANGNFLHDGTDLVGTISSSNALIGNNDYDRVGGSVYNFYNGSILLRTDMWGGNQGAWTWIDVTTAKLANGQAAVGGISSSNSLVGGTAEAAGGGSALIESFGSDIYGVRNYLWDSATAVDAGALTLFNSSTGQFLNGTAFTGVVSSNNSLVGTLANDRVGYDGVEYINGKYLVNSPYWGNNQGAWTWIDPINNHLVDGASSIAGAVDDFNSLVGGTGGDSNGSFTDVAHIGGNNYLLLNPNWDSFSANNVGAITVFNASTGRNIDGDLLAGDIHSENSLIGSSLNDRVGVQYPTYLDGTNYILRHNNWGDNEGAWTWINGTNLTFADGQLMVGVVGRSNSIVGGTGGDTAQSAPQFTDLGGGTFIMYNSGWDSATAINAGAATLFNASTGKFLDNTNFVGAISSSNSLVGSSANDQVGGGGLRYMGGGWILSSPYWGDNQGAWTWFHPPSGEFSTGQEFAGVLSTSNSLVGGEGGDSSGSFPNYYNMGSGNYLIYNDDWDAPGSAYNAGALTVIDGINGTFIDGSDLIGTIGSSNSLVGSNLNDRVGSWGIWNMGGGLFIQSPYWGDNQGAWTWLNTSTFETATGQPFAGVLGAGNSLVGGTGGDFNISNSTRSLDNNLYALANQEWDSVYEVDAGAITLFNGDTGKFLDGSAFVGTVSAANSLVGGSEGDRVGYDATNLSGAILFESPYWGDNQGAWTWIDTSTGELANGQLAAGFIGDNNSLVGGTSGDINGAFVSVTNFGSGNYLLRNSGWDAPGSLFNAGALTMFKGSDGTFMDGSELTGVISSSNSLVGSNAGDNVGNNNPWWVGGGYLLASSFWGGNQGAWTWVDPATGLLADGSAFKGVVGVSNSLVGGTAGDSGGSYANTYSIGDGYYFLANSGWDGDGAEDAGAVTVINGADGSFFDGSTLVGAISASNSYVGERAFDQLGSTGIQTLINGQRYAVFSPLYDSASATNVGRVFMLDLVTTEGSPVSDSTFATDAASNLSIDSASVQATLNTGTNLLLQANNDLTVSDSITVNNSGDGGNLTLQAGRSVLINADITTDNGNLNLVANDDDAVLANRESGAGNISIAGGITINTGTGSQSFKIEAGSEAGAINVSGSLLTSTGNITLQNEEIGGAINLASNASIDAGNSTSSTESNVNFFVDDLNITTGAEVSGYTFTLTPTSNVYSLGLAGGSGDLTLSQDELNALDFTSMISLNSGLAGGDIEIGNYTSTQSPQFYRFVARDDLTLTEGISVPNRLYLFVDYDDNSIDTMDLRGSISASSVNLYSAGIGGTTYNDILNLPDTTNTLTVNNPNIDFNFAGVEGEAYRFGSLVGGSGADSFNISVTNVLSSIDGGQGSDTFDYTGYTTPITVDLQAGTTPNITTFSSIENFIGGSDDDLFLLNNANYTINSIVGAGGVDTVTQTAGTLNLSGNLDAEIVTMTGGVFGGTGTINGNVTLDGGVMSVGNSPGQLTINGNYTQTANTTFLAELGGTSQGVDYDFLDVTGTVTLAGTLDVTLINSFQPQFQDSFEVIRSQSGNIVGDFTTTNLPAGLDWTAGVNTNLYQLINNTETLPATTQATNSQNSQILALNEQTEILQEEQTGAGGDTQGVLVDETQTTTGELVDETQEPSTGELVDETQSSGSSGELVDETGTTATEVAGEDEITVEVDLYPPSDEPLSGLALPEVGDVTLVEAIETLNNGEYTPADQVEFYHGLEQDQVVEEFTLAGQDALAEFYASTASGQSTSESDLVAILSDEGIDEEQKISYLGIFTRMRHIGMKNLLAGALDKLRINPDAADVFDDGEAGKPLEISLNQSRLDSDNGIALLEGQVESESKLLYLGINNRWVFVDEQGRFKTQIALPEGESTVQLRASDVAGVSTTASVPANSRIAGKLPPIQGKRIALLIGVEEYDNAIPELDTPVSDIQAVAKKLDQEQGFKTQTLENPTKQEILDTLQQLAGQLGEGDSLMVYYAGHGYQLEESGRGYWLPRDAETTTPNNWVSNRDIARLFHRTPAKQVMLISDSCYSGTFTRNKNTDNIQQDDVRLLRAVMAMSSGGEQPVWDGGGEGHSIFTAKLLDTVKPGKIQGLPFYQQIRQKVVKAAPQIPGYGAMVLPGYDKGADFILK